MMLRAVPKGWFSYDFEVFDRTGASVGRANLSNWRENAQLDVGGKRYEATHKGGKKEFVLSRGDSSVVLVAEKPSAWKRDFVLSRAGIGAVGSLRPEGAIRRAWVAELPDELPPEVRVFVMWLGAVLWNREDAAATAGA